MARIHRANLVNFGILPLLLVDKADYDRIPAAAGIRLDTAALAPGQPAPMTVEGVGEVMVVNDLTAKELDIIKAGGLLNQVRQARA